MGKKIYFLLPLSCSLIAIVFCIIGFVYLLNLFSTDDNNQSEDTLVSHIEFSENDQTITSHKKAELKKVCWDYTKYRKGMYGTLIFDDLSNIEKIVATYQNDNFREILVDNALLTTDLTKNICIISFDHDEPPSYYQLEIYYKDGRTEIFFDKISIE